MLSWARNRAGLTVGDIAKKVNIKDEKINDWEIGHKQPTFKQAMNFAKKTGIPFGYLFLSQPPIEKLTIPDLRTVDSKHTKTVSPELLAIIEKMQSRQNWYREYLIELQADKIKVVGRFNLNSCIKEIVDDLREKLGVKVYPSKGNWEDYYKDLVHRIENVGVLVMRQRFLQFNNRELNVDEFRGFALMDDYAPLIFINHADVPYARLFTLIHELAHLWIGKSGVSDTDIKNHRKEEQLCNAVAGEFLVAEKVFRKDWKPNIEPWYTQLDQLRQLFHVSNWVLARRALSLEFITRAEYQSYIDDLRQTYLENQKGKGSGGNFYSTRRAEVSIPFSKAVLREIRSGQLLMRDGADLLGLQPKHLKSFSQRRMENDK